MAVQLYTLRGVPDDEADEIRQMLTDHHIDFYETPGSMWGLSVPTIWLKEPERLAEAQKLIAEYQSARFQAAREAAEAGDRPGFWHSVCRHPFRFLAVIILIAWVFYLSVTPFLNIGAKNVAV